MDPVCIWFGAICRADIHSGKMRHPEDGFRHGHGHPDDRGPAVFVADGGHRRLRADHHRPEREDVGLSNPLGPRDRRVVAVLFPRAAARRREQGRSHR